MKFTFEKYVSAIFCMKLHRGPEKRLSDSGTIAHDRTTLKQTNPE